MFFLKKKRKKIEIPSDLRIELRELQQKLRKEAEERENEPKISYSLSPSKSTLNKAVNEIKSTPLKPSFKELLFNYIDERNLTDPFVYKKAKVDKRTFSKLRTGEIRYVSKKTTICLGLALELDLDDFEKLLDANHHSLYGDTYFDVAIRWCIKNKIYDIEQVNDILYACDLDLLTK